MSNTTTTKHDTLLAALNTLAFTPAKWDRPDARQLDARMGDKTIRVAFREEEEITVIGFTGGRAMLVAWEATFTAATPTEIILATIKAAVDK